MKLLKSMPFRLTMAFTVLYLLCFTIASVIFYRTLEDKVRGEMDRSLLERHALAQEIYAEVGLHAVEQLIDNNEHKPMESTLGFHLASADGERIAGNVPTCTTQPGWLSIPGHDLGLETDSVYRFYTASLGDNILSLGMSTRRLEGLRKYSIHSFLTTFFITTLLALLGATLLAHRSHARVRNIATAMERVAAGNLGARLPVSKRGDDIDQLSDNMNDALGLLQQQVDGMQQVSADIAHDLKTPLNRLYINIERAANKCHHGEDVTQELDSAITEAKNINDTFEALLRIAQIEAGSRKSKFIAIDLLPVLQTAVEVFEPVAGDKQQVLALVLDKSVEENAGLHMLGDRDLLMQLVVNLVENAIRHCPSRTRIEISAGVMPEQNTVWLRVADNGPGILPELREKVFQRLYRLESSRTTPGSGLGLSLVKAVSELHCGKLTVSDNNPGLVVDIQFDGDCPVE